MTIEELKQKLESKEEIAFHLSNVIYFSRTHFYYVSKLVRES